MKNVKIFAVGAAPIARSTLEFFFSLNWVILNMYGMSETTAPTSVNTYGNANLLSAGKALPGTTTVIMDEFGSILENGERGEV